MINRKKQIMNQKFLSIHNSWAIHPSYKKNLEFQRLEFFGDKIIAFEVSKMLLKDIRLNEGQLSIVLSSLVCRDTMAEVGKFLIPHMKYTGKLTVSMIASTLEAWIGYHYMLDKENVSKIIYDLWDPYMDQKFQSNVKNLIQEYAQKNNYKLIYSYEKNHKNQFICQILMHNYEFFAEAQSKKKASEMAAFQVCKELNLI